ncbi:hypothetical protein [Shewanella baltica]|uniref:hypothetical protein n=1 Tax=Shewanella baltica TaxID=62322 RepID=UPI00217EDE9E|nr:hypothetical protein [Shewanella baltica]MCS6235820.1 hypothetical protein [Shewanella baltica]MCS6259236.1 hypothetical protein [Shewanella baltica]MCS6270437.1 hypothetical protein [Shewanella baltica]
MSRIDTLTDEMDLYYRTLEDRPDIGWFLQGHIVVEYMLRKRLVDITGSTSKKLEKSGFYKVLLEAEKYGVVNKDQKVVLEKINSIRNRYAHELDYLPQLSEWLDIWRSAKAAFCDMTDGIEQGLAELESVEKLEDAERFHLNELFVQICHDLLQSET